MLTLYQSLRFFNGAADRKLNMYGITALTSSSPYSKPSSSFRSSFDSGNNYQTANPKDETQSDEHLDYGDDDDGEDDEDDEGDAWLIDEATTPFNQISVIELDEGADHSFAGAYVLKLEGADANMIHSVYWNNGRVWTGSYYDVFASLIPLLPEGPVGIFGLGAGTVARLLLHLWPSLNLEGWELDPEVVRIAREYFRLLDLESSEPSPVANRISKNRFRPFSNTPYQIRPEECETSASSPSQHPDFTGKSIMRKLGRLVVHVGDALSPDAIVEGGFAGVVVDLFTDGGVCKELEEVETWKQIKARLRPGGRVMINCVANSSNLALEERLDTLKDWDHRMQAIVRSMDAVFPGEVSMRVLDEEGNNVMLLSGKPPDVVSWSSKVPNCLVQGVREWRLWDEHALVKFAGTQNL